MSDTYANLDPLVREMNEEQTKADWKATQEKQTKTKETVREHIGNLSPEQFKKAARDALAKGSGSVIDSTKAKLEKALKKDASRDGGRGAR